MRLWEITDKWGIYGGPAPRRDNSDGHKSPLTDPGTEEWQNEKDFAKKWFSLPYLTNGPKGNHMLPIKKKKVS